MTTISITKARTNLYDLVEDVSKGKRVGITNRGETRVVLISQAELESLEETLDILSDPKALRELKEAEEQVARGELIEWEDLKKELRLARKHAKHSV